jgi:hypothetical protein
MERKKFIVNARFGIDIDMDTITMFEDFTEKLKSKELVLDNVSIVDILESETGTVIAQDIDLTEGIIEHFIKEEAE